MRCGRSSQRDERRQAAFLLTLFILTFLLLAGRASYPQHTAASWEDDFLSNAEIFFSSSALLSGGSLRLRGEVFYLGTVTQETFETYSLISASNGLVYGGTGTPGFLFAYDPDDPEWDPGAEEGCNPRILGLPFQAQWEGRGVMGIYDLMEGPGGVIYGSLYYWDGDRPEESRQKGGRVFAYNPSLPWSPGSDPSSNPRDLGQAVSGENGVLSLCLGNDGMIYGGTIASPSETSPPPPESGGHLFRLDPGTVWGEEPDFQDLGKVDGEIDEIWAVTPHPDVAYDVIFAASGSKARLYRCDTAPAPSFQLLGEVSGEINVADALTGGDGRIYFGTYPTCRLCFYDPADPGAGITDLGTVLENQRELSALCWGPDGLLYLGTYGHSRGGWFDGSVMVYDPATGRLENYGPPVENYIWINRLCARQEGGDTVVYGTGISNVLFRFTRSSLFDQEGWAASNPVYPQAPVIGQVTFPPNTRNADQRVASLCASSEGDIYGGTFVDFYGHPELSREKGGYLFRYRPAGEPGSGSYENLGKPLEEEYGLTALVQGEDGGIYIGTTPHACLARFLPGEGVYEYLGQPLAGEKAVTCLASPGDGYVYGGTFPGGKLFRYSPAAGLELLGMPVEGKSEVSALVAGMDGALYGTAGVGAVLFSYRPDLPWSPGEGEGANPRIIADLGYENYARALVVSSGGRVFAGTAPSGMVYVYDPNTEELACEEPGLGRGFYAACPGSDGKIYLGSAGAEATPAVYELLIRFEDGTYLRRPYPGGWEDLVTALTLGKNGRIYLGTGLFGYLVEYEPGYFFRWDRVHYSAVCPPSTSLTVDLEDAEMNPVRAGVSAGEDISAIDPLAFPALRIRGNLATADPSASPEVEDWGLTWQPGGDPPELYSLSAQEGWCGMELTLKGRGFGAEKGSSRVTFGGVGATECLWWQDDLITVKVPCGAVGGPVRVTTMCGESEGLDFQVVPGPLHHFDFNPIGPQSAGVPFSVTITARDACDNIVTSFSGTAALSSTLGEVEPSTTGPFSEGSWSGQVTLRTAGSGIRLTASCGEASGQSSPFQVVPGPLHHFDFNPIGPQSAGVPFSVTITARDACDNIVTSFSGTAALSSTLGEVEPSTTGPFSEGSWSGQVTLRTAGSGIRLTASCGEASGQSEPFQVLPGPLHHFDLSPVGPQVTGVPFPLTITARDACGNTVTSFEGSAELADLTGTLEPGEVALSSGIWAGQVVVKKERQGDIITASWEGISGSSGPFDVKVGPEGRVWMFAEGYTGEGFEEWLCLANFGTLDATVRITYLYEDAPPYEREPLLVPAGRRRTLDVNAEAGQGRNLSIKVEADRPIVAERPIYFDYKGKWTGGHDVLGASSGSTELYFAEGYTGEGFEEWLCLANFGTLDATVRITYLYEDAPPYEREPLLVPAGRRRTLDVNAEAGQGRNLSIKVEADRPIVAERPIYFDYKGKWTGGHDVLGATP